MTPDFKTNFQEILKVVEESAIYTDILNMHKEHIIDKKTYETIMVSFHQNVLPEAIQMSKDLILSMQEVETTKEDGSTEKMTLQKTQIIVELEKLNEAKERTLLMKEQVKTEKERTKLIAAQTKGFYDNRVIHFVEAMGSIAGEIQGGGNETPQAVWDALFSGDKALAALANLHPDLKDSTAKINVGTAPQTP